MKRDEFVEFHDERHRNMHASFLERYKTSSRLSAAATTTTAIQYSATC